MGSWGARACTYVFTYIFINLIEERCHSVIWGQTPLKMNELRKLKSDNRPVELKNPSLRCHCCPCLLTVAANPLTGDARTLPAPDSIYT